MTLSGALGRPELRDGFLWGVVLGGPVALAGFGLARGKPNHRAWSTAGIVVVVGAVLAFRDDERIPQGAVLVGLLVVGLAGLVSPMWRVSILVPGALAVASSLPSSLPRWATVLVFLGTVVGGVTAPVVDRRHGPGIGPVLLAISALGAWACIPDVERVAVVAGCSVAVAILAMAVPLRLGAIGAPAAVALLLWAAAMGATGRPAALIGAVASLGFLVVNAAVVSGVANLVTGPVTVVLHFVLVSVTSRMAGVQGSPQAAVLLAVGALSVAFVVNLCLTVRNAASRGSS